jgi:hypothetical protein
MSVLRPGLNHEQERLGAFTGYRLDKPVNMMPPRYLWVLIRSLRL